MTKLKTISPDEVSLRELHGTMLSAVGPRPICFASTIDANGKVNLSPFSFFNVFSSRPPMMIFSPARSGRTNTNKHTFENIQEVKEVVINIVNYPLVEQMSLASTAYPKGVNEFIKAGLTEVASQKVQPPRVKEAPVAFECTVDRVIELGTEGGAGNLIFAKVELIHIDESILDEQGTIDPNKIDLVGRMGGNWYCRASGDALFSINKPLSVMGIGIDQLPEFIRNSHDLSGNELGILGGVDRLPTPEEITNYKQELVNESHLSSKEAILERVKQLIVGRNAMEAITLLCAFEKP